MTADPGCPTAHPAPLQLWGGVEGSVVRVGDAWRDQVRETGHQDRIGDLDRVAALGIRTLRYPVLWERCAWPLFGAVDWDSALRQSRGRYEAGTWDASPKPASSMAPPRHPDGGGAATACTMPHKGPSDDGQYATHA